MQDKHLITQLEASSLAIAASLAKILDASESVGHALNALRDPESTPQCAHEESEIWRQKYIAECKAHQETREKFKSADPRRSAIYLRLEGPVLDLKHIANVWREADDKDSVFYWGYQMVDKADEIMKIWSDKPEETDAPPAQAA